MPPLGYRTITVKSEVLDYFRKKWVYYSICNYHYISFDSYICMLLGVRIIEQRALNKFARRIKK